MISPIIMPLIGVIVVLTLAIFAFRKEMLNEGGTLAALVLGIAIFILPKPPYEGWIWFVLLAAFFIFSSLATRFKSFAKKEVNADFAKGGVRDFAQVAANGAAPAFIAAVFHFYPEPIVFAAFVASIAVVIADTFATEIGVLSKSKPFLITSLKRVETGASGAMSLLGTGAGIIAALFIALLAIVLVSLPQILSNQLVLSFPGNSWLFVPIIVIAGFLGMVADSILGATCQVMFYCEHCKKVTEKKVHGCGHQTRVLRGARWFDNDITNLFSAIIGAAIAAVLFYLFV